MRIKYDVLESDLKKGLKPLYLVSGDEPLQQMEACDMIRQVARKQGFTEREVFHVERGFDWGQLFLSANSMSLFAEKKILELRFNSAKPGDVGGKAFAEYCQNMNTDNILIITMPKIDAAGQRSKWFKLLDQSGAIMQLWPVEPNQLPSWIANRMRNKGLTPSREAVLLLAEKVEGNMLAAAQEIEKLAINAPANISAEDIIEAVEDAAKFDVFKLVDAILMAKLKRTTRIMQGLKATGEEPVYVLWALTREIRTMTSMAYAQQKGDAIGVVLKKHGVWDKRASLVKAGLQRLNEKQWSALLQEVMQVDLVIKGVKKGSPWDALLDLSFAMTGKKFLS